MAGSSDDAVLDALEAAETVYDSSHVASEEQGDQLISMYHILFCSWLISKVTVCILLCNWSVFKVPVCLLLCIWSIFVVAVSIIAFMTTRANSTP